MESKEEVSVSDGLLVSLEKSYNEAMSALEGESNLGHFRLEYERLYKALKKSHESEKALVAKCQDLTQELLSNAAKMQAAVKLSQGDHSTIEALKREIEKAWKTVDSANDKDSRARITVKSLQQEIVTLQSMVREGSAFSSDHTSTLEELKLENKRLQAEGEEMIKQADTLTKEMTDMSAALKISETNVQANNDDYSRLLDRFELVRQEYRREKNALGRADYQCRELLTVLQSREKELKNKEALKAKIEKSVENYQRQIDVQMSKQTGIQQKLDAAEKQLFHTLQSYNDSVDTTSDLNERIETLEKKIAEAEKKIVESRDENERVRKIRENDFKEMARLKQLNDSIRQDHKDIIHQRELVIRRTGVVKKENASLEEALALMEKEHGMLKKRGLQTEKKQANVLDQIKTEKEHQQEIEESVQREKEISNRLKNTISRLEKDREKCVTEVSQINVQHASAMEELKMATLSVDEAQKGIEDCQAKLDAQQAKYEQIRSERNQISKKLVESQDEIVELKQKFKMMDHQVMQFREELQLKTKKFIEETAMQNQSKERLTIARKQVNDNTAKFDETKQKSEALSQQIKQLVKIINDCDQDLSKQQQEFLKVTNERDALGTQIIRRNDELALLYEKLNLQKETLQSGEAAMRARIEDGRLIRFKTQEIQRQAKIANIRCKDAEQLKEKVKIAERDVASERARAAALSEELESPQNTTRWRLIEGKDPTPEELEKRIKELQKRLITKSEESLEHELALQEKERLVTELQAILSRQPGPEVALQLSTYTKTLQKTNSKMKQKASELNMTSTHISELKYEAERLRRELHETKRKYYEVEMQNDDMIQRGQPTVSANQRTQ